MLSRLCFGFRNIREAPRHAKKAHTEWKIRPAARLLFSNRPPWRQTLMKEVEPYINTAQDRDLKLVTIDEEATVEDLLNAP
jgi:hypothetical protein